MSPAVSYPDTLPLGDYLNFGDNKKKTFFKDLSIELRERGIWEAENNTEVPTRNIATAFGPQGDEAEESIKKIRFGHLQHHTRALIIQDLPIHDPFSYLLNSQLPPLRNEERMSSYNHTCRLPKVQEIIMGPKAIIDIHSHVLINSPKNLPPFLHTLTQIIEPIHLRIQYPFTTSKTGLDPFVAQKLASSLRNFANRFNKTKLTTVSLYNLGPDGYLWDSPCAKDDCEDDDYLKSEIRQQQKVPTTMRIFLDKLPLPASGPRIPYASVDGESDRVIGSTSRRIANYLQPHKLPLPHRKAAYLQTPVYSFYLPYTPKMNQQIRFKTEKLIRDMSLAMRRTSRESEFYRDIFENLSWNDIDVEDKDDILLLGGCDLVDWLVR